MTEIAEAAREGSAAPDAITESGPQSAQRARIVALPSLAMPGPVTQRGEAAKRILARTAEFLDRPGSLVHAQPPTFAEARVLHHVRAGKHNVPLLRVASLTYGYLHLILLKPVLNFLEWVTETPLRFFAAVILFTVIWIWS